MDTQVKNVRNNQQLAKRVITLLATLLMIVMPGFTVSNANAAGVDVTLATFTIDGTAVTDGDVLIVPLGTTSVTVVATPTDNAATVSITGGTNLQTYDNNVLVTVTGSDSTTTATYTVDVYVTDRAPGFSHDANLSELRVNGNIINPNDVVEVPALTNAVTVVVVPNDTNATSAVTGARNLVTGANTVTVTITAEDGTTTKTYTFKVRVAALSSDVALDTFTLNGQPVRSGGRVYLDPGTQSVNVVATPSDPSSSVVVTGKTGLVAGANTLQVVVTAESGATATYTVTLNVQTPSSISSLVVFKVSGARVTDGSTVIVPNGTTAVLVTAVPTDSSASVEVTGSSNLQTGDNSLSVLVTAEDGSTTTYGVTLRVLQNDDTSLSLFQYDGNDVADGDTFDVANDVTAVEIVAEATSSLSTVTITGADALLPGRNAVKITVTAEDGSSRTQRLIFNVAPSTNTDLDSLTVAGQDAIGGAVTVPSGTRAVVVTAVTADPFATYVVDGNTGLEPGDNSVTVTVTAADGETTADFAITVTVQAVVLSNDTGVSSITVAGQDGLSGAVSVGIGTRAVLVQVVTADAFATFAVDGNTALEPGDNTVTVTVTAADGETSQDYTVTVSVPVLSDDASYALFQVNGVDVNDGDQVNLPYGTRKVNVKAEVTDSGATFSIAGDGKTSALVEGDQELVLTVTAANGDSAAYTVTLTVLPLSQNANLDPENGLTINGELVDPELIDNPAGYIDVPLDTKIISIGATPEDVNSDVFVNNKTVLPGVSRVFSVESGVNAFQVKVIPQAGTNFAKTYTIKVYVGGADATLKTVKVNNTVISFNEDHEGSLAAPLAHGTTSATIFVDPTVEQAVGSGNGTKIEFDAGDASVTKATAANTWNVTGLVTGDNAVSIVVTPGDSAAEQVTYSLNIPVDLSSDATLKVFRIDGNAVTVGSTQILALDTTSVEIDGETNDPNATFEVEGGDEVLPGLNTLKITVTAEKGNTAVYTVTAIVPKAKDVVVVGFPKLGVVTVDAKTNAAGNKVLAAEVKKLTGAKANIVKVEITNNFLIGKDKPAAGVARATAVQKFFQTAKLNGVKTAIYSLIVGDKKQKGTTVTIYYY